MDCSFSDKGLAAFPAANRNTGTGSGSVFSAAKQTRFSAGLSGECDYQSGGSVSGLLVSVSDAVCSTLDCNSGICGLAVGGVDLPEMPDRTAESVFLFFGAQCGFLFRRDGL